MPIEVLARSRRWRPARGSRAWSITSSSRPPRRSRTSSPTAASAPASTSRAVAAARRRRAGLRAGRRLSRRPARPHRRLLAARRRRAPRRGRLAGPARDHRPGPRPRGHRGRASSWRAQPGVHPRAPARGSRTCAAWRAASSSTPAALNIDQDVSLEAFDELGALVPGIEIDPPSVRVRADVARQLAYVTLPVLPQLTGEPARARGSTMSRSCLPPSRSAARTPRCASSSRCRPSRWTSAAWTASASVEVPLVLPPEVTAQGEPVATVVVTFAEAHGLAHVRGRHCVARGPAGAQLPTRGPGGERAVLRARSTRSTRSMSPSSSSRCRWATSRSATMLSCRPSARHAASASSDSCPRRCVSPWARPRERPLRDRRHPRGRQRRPEASPRARPRSGRRLAAGRSRRPGPRRPGHAPLGRHARRRARVGRHLGGRGRPRPRASAPRRRWRTSPPRPATRPASWSRPRTTRPTTTASRSSTARGRSSTTRSRTSWPRWSCAPTSWPAPRTTGLGRIVDARRDLERYLSHRLGLATRHRLGPATSTSTAPTAPPARVAPPHPRRQRGHA